MITQYFADEATSSEVNEPPARSNKVQSEDKQDRESKCPKEALEQVLSWLQGIQSEQPDITEYEKTNGMLF